MTAAAPTTLWHHRSAAVRAFAVRRSEGGPGPLDNPWLPDPRWSCIFRRCWLWRREIWRLSSKLSAGAGRISSSTRSSMKRVRATMEARKGRVKSGSMSGRWRQPSSGATSLRPISSSSTCGDGSTCTCMARHRAIRTAVLSGARACPLSNVGFISSSSRPTRTGPESISRLALT
jgi:hypothetical protein